MYVKKIIFEISLDIVVKIQNIEQVLWMIQRLRVMKLPKWTQKLSRTTKRSQTMKKQKLFQQILMKKIYEISTFCLP